jgi:hypothetical protein
MRFTSRTSAWARIAADDRITQGLGNHIRFNLTYREGTNETVDIDLSSSQLAELDRFSLSNELRVVENADESSDNSHP